MKFINIGKRFLKLILKDKYGMYSYSLQFSKRICDNSLIVSKNKGCIESQITELRILTHTIDKGLHMISVKKGFGYEKTKEIVRILDAYVNTETLYCFDAYFDAVQILHEYVSMKNKYGLNCEHINLDKYPITQEQLIKYRKSSFSGMYNTCNFKELALNRHSVRDFDGRMIPDNIIYDIVNLCRMSPSACNRQPISLLFINDAQKANCILELQAGLRGSVGLNNCALILADLKLYRYPGEVNTLFVDAGLFMMNFLYSLKYFGLDGCPLIWDDNSPKSKELRKIVDIPDNYYVVAMVVAGYANNEAKKLISPRKSVEDILYINSMIHK